MPTCVFAIGECSLGSILVAASDKGISAIFLGDDPDYLVRISSGSLPESQSIGGDRAFEDVIAKVVGLVEEPATSLDLPLDVRGTAFQHRVWQALREIPAGSTATLFGNCRTYRHAESRARRRRCLRRQ